jgi:DNA-3-methyladenine glycosylase I
MSRVKMPPTKTSAHQDTKDDDRHIVKRCSWAKSPLMIGYHDSEWGVPVSDERTFFEFLILEGAQAGLSWETVLKKRDTYRKVFDNFDAAAVALYKSNKIARLLAEPGIIRNRLKILAAVENAKAFLKVQSEFGTFNNYVRRFVDGQTRTNIWKSEAEVPARSAESDALSADLKRRKFKFVGSTICYAFMQATGLVNDHVVSCFRHKQL